MGYQFDGPNAVISLTPGTTTLNLYDLWSRWIDWLGQGDNSKYPLAIRQIGNEDIDTAAGTAIPLYLYLQNGWRIKPQEANHSLSVTGGILLVTGGGDPFIATDGNFNVRISYQSPVQAITVASGGGTVDLTQLVTMVQTAINHARAANVQTKTP